MKRRTNPALDFFFPWRIARISYFIRTCALGALVTLLLDHSEQLHAGGLATEGNLLIGAALAVFVYWTAFVVAPRCRDLAMSGWFALIMLVPAIDVVVAAYLAWGRTKVRGGEGNSPVARVAAPKPREHKSEGLRRLESLRDEGLLTEQDFLRRKARLQHEEDP